MPRLTERQTMPNFTFCTPFEKNLTIRETASSVGGKTALVFLRYYGCTLCQLDLHDFAQHYSRIAEAGSQLLVVLQSNPDSLSGQITPQTFPFRIICDPDQTLYRQFEIQPASSKLKLADWKTVKKIFRAQKAGYSHGDYEGDELQLPAVFVLNPNLELTYVHYGKSAADIPTAAELCNLLQ